MFRRSGYSRFIPAFLIAIFVISPFALIGRAEATHEDLNRFLKAAYNKYPGGGKKNERRRATILERAMCKEVIPKARTVQDLARISQHYKQYRIALNKRIYALARRVRDRTLHDHIRQDARLRQKRLNMAVKSLLLARESISKCLATRKAEIEKPAKKTVETTPKTVVIASRSPRTLQELKINIESTYGKDGSNGWYINGSPVLHSGEPPPDKKKKSLSIFLKDDGVLLFARTSLRVFGTKIEKYLTCNLSKSVNGNTFSWEGGDRNGFHYRVQLTIELAGTYDKSKKRVPLIVTGGSVATFHPEDDEYRYAGILKSSSGLATKRSTNLTAKRYDVSNPPECEKFL